MSKSMHEFRIGSGQGGRRSRGGGDMFAAAESLAASLRVMVERRLPDGTLCWCRDKIVDGKHWTFCEQAAAAIKRFEATRSRSSGAGGGA